VYRGPLAYSLKIGERWEKYSGTDKWPEFQVFPTTPWNYGLLIDSKNPVTSFEVVKSPRVSSQPFTLENAPVELHAKGKRIPQWEMQPNGLVGEIQPSFGEVRSDEPVDDITLIPMGCARLRISVFPQISENSNADVWK
jgi:hypothetical protein